MIVSMMQTLPVPILGRIQSDLGASAAGISWVTTATLLSAAVFTPLLGRYGDQHGKKRTLVGVLVVMVIGSIVAALAHNLPLLILGRVSRGPPPPSSRWLCRSCAKRSAHTSFPARWHWSAELSHSAAGSPS